MALQMDTWSYFTLLKTGDQARFVAMSPAQLLHLRLDLSVNLAAASSATTRHFWPSFIRGTMSIGGWEKTVVGFRLPWKKAKTQNERKVVSQPSIFKGANC